MIAQKLDKTLTLTALSPTSHVAKCYNDMNKLFSTDNNNHVNSISSPNIFSQKHSANDKVVENIIPVVAKVTHAPAVHFTYENLSPNSIKNIDDTGHNDGNKTSTTPKFLDDLKKELRKRSNASGIVKYTDSNETELESHREHSKIFPDKSLVIGPNVDSIDTSLQTECTDVETEYISMTGFNTKDDENCSDNLPDDLKVKLSVVEPDKEMYLPMFCTRTTVIKSKSTSDFDSCVVSKPPSKGIYATMSSGPINSYKKHSSKSSMESCHMRGDVTAGCIFSPSENEYIYNYNPDNSHVNNVFIKTNEKVEPLPCFCDKNKSKEKVIHRNEEVYYSCENLDCTPEDAKKKCLSLDEELDENVVLHRFDNQSADSDSKDENNQSLLTKKLRQLKLLITEW